MRCACMLVGQSRRALQSQVKDSGQHSWSLLLKLGLAASRPRRMPCPICSHPNGIAPSVCNKVMISITQKKLLGQVVGCATLMHKRYFNFLAPMMPSLLGTTKIQRKENPKEKTPSIHHWVYRSPGPKESFHRKLESCPRLPSFLQFNDAIDPLICRTNWDYLLLITCYQLQGTLQVTGDGGNEVMSPPKF